MRKNYTLAVTLDCEAAAGIERVEAEIASIHGQRRLYGNDVRPHLTFGMFESVEVEAAADVLDEFATRFAPIAVTFGSLGLFVLETDVVFAAPIVTAELLECHAWLHERLVNVTNGPFSPLLPGSWVPHATLAADVPLDVLPGVIVASRALTLPLEGRLETVLLARFPIGPVLHTAHFGVSV